MTISILKNKKNTLITIILLFTALAFNHCNKPESVSKIKQSNFVYEDNVNGRIPPPNNVIESTNFYYNDNNLLERATVYDDTTSNAHLIKELNISYASDRVIINTYLDTVGNIIYHITYNDKKQVTSVTLGDTAGLHFSYFDDKVSEIIDDGADLVFVNFRYDNNDNLLQYELKRNNFIIGRAVLEYSNELLPSEFDSKFLNKDVRYIYIGGLDLISKLGLNLGKNTQNKLIRRTEIELPSNQIFETYNFGYTHNSKGDVVKRDVKFSTDTLYYQFKY